MDKCGQCGREIPDEYCKVPRIPCPHCGGMSRNFFRSTTATVKMSSSLSWSMTRPGPYGKATIDDQGKVDLDIAGQPPRNEDDALDITKRLVSKLNADGAAWGEVASGDADIDACAIGEEEGTNLNMQVVRASTDQEMWRALAYRGTVQKESSTADVAVELHRAIEKKANKYPASQRSRLTLVLDAGRTPSHTLNQVHEIFAREYGDRCKYYGFAGVWVVGSSEAQVTRLDR